MRARREASSVQLASCVWDRLLPKNGGKPGRGGVGTGLAGEGLGFQEACKPSQHQGVVTPHSENQTNPEGMRQGSEKPHRPREIKHVKLRHGSTRGPGLETWLFVSVCVPVCVFRLCLCVCLCPCSPLHAATKPSCFESSKVKRAPLGVVANFGGNEAAELMGLYTRGLPQPHEHDPSGLVS